MYDFDEVNNSWDHDSMTVRNNKIIKSKHCSAAKCPMKFCVSVKRLKRIEALIQTDENVSLRDITNK